MFQAVSELKAAFHGRMAWGGTQDDNSFCFYTLNRPGASLSEPELQYFAENCRVSEIFELFGGSCGTPVRLVGSPR